MISRKVKMLWCVFAFIGFIAGLGCILMLLWNALIPSIFSGITISYWQALGLLILARLLFGGFGFHKFGGRLHGFHHHHHHHREFEKMHNMSKDDRREMIRRHMASHGFFGCEREPEKEKENE